MCTILTCPFSQVLGNKTTTMESQSFLHVTLRFIAHLTLFVLFVQFYLMEQMGDYVKDRTTTTSRFEEVEVSDFPTITICMDPPQKPSIAKQYGYKRMVDIHFNDVPNTTLPERFEASSYILNKDFDIKVDDKDFLKLGDNDEFVVRPMVTFFEGICHNIEPKFKVTQQWFHKEFSIKLKEDLIDRPKNFKVYLTSNAAILNIATDIWPQYLTGRVTISFQNRVTTVIKSRAIEYKFKTGVNNSKECVTKIIEESECKNKCFYINGTSLPICNSASDFDCIWSHYNQWQKCLLQKHAVAFVPHIDEVSIYDTDISDAFEISASSKTKQIMEEVDVITFAGLIGSVGGSLGMFFGFSFTSYLSIVIERFTKKNIWCLVKNIFNP